MSKWIGPEQSNFIDNRSTCDNIILAQEAIHSLRLRGRKKGFVAVKVDMEKAFGRLDWGFVEDTLKCINLDTSLINLIMACNTTSSLSILWNGDPSPYFQASRGVRQGDPLSPYIFVLCMERLSHLIKQECDAKRWKPFRFRCIGPALSHLFFADDLILFSEASLDQMQEIREVMESFCKVSGHRINLAKSKMFCSRNVHFHRATELSEQLGVGLAGDLGKYLGVPLIHSKVTVNTFSPLVQKG